MVAVEHKSTVADFTGPQLIVPSLRQREWEAVLCELVALLHHHGSFQDAQLFLEAVMKREALGPTTTPFGWALPHGRMAGVSRLSFAFGRSPIPLLWGEQRQPKVRLVFLFAVPENDSRSYLELVSALARASRQKDFERHLLGASNGLEVLEMLKGIPLRVPPSLTRRQPELPPATSSPVDFCL
ncbi:MAG TPA: PTS sugar transporter subunit IIA [Verrucomicrobiae bacterium]|nr:PTS sugar transporter subunit IIA [Verrucomicrobiae bacterium]